MKNKILIAMLFIGSIYQIGCSSADKPTQTQYQEDRVLGRSDSRTSRPDWVTETVSVRQNGSKVQFIGVAEVPADSRVQAAFKMSDSAARGNVANKVETNITKIVENSETGMNMEDQSLKSLIHEMSQVSLNNVDIHDRYWEKVERTSSTGQASAVMKVFSLIEMDKEDLLKLILDKKRTTASSPDLKNQVEKIVRSQWDTAPLAQ
ncbi:MAG: hypothetical protein ACXVAX_04615 [Pseudobdellovibrio sp.]